MRKTPIAVLALAAIPAVAQQATTKTPGTRNLAAVSAGTYQVDPNHTLVMFTLDHLGFTPYTGIFGSATGTLTIDPKLPNAAKVDVTIPVAKVTLANAALTAHLLRPGQDGGKPDFFGAAPADAHFVSTKVVAHGQTAQVTGDFTLNGVTRPVTLTVSFYGAGALPQPATGSGLGFTATGKLLRSEFGLTTALPVIGDEVSLNIAAAFKK